jgi:adenylate cyclase
VNEVDFERAGLLDPSAPSAGERLELLRYLVDRGATLDDLLRALEEGRLAEMAAELVRRAASARVTARELAERAGIDVDLVMGIRAAAGLPRVEPDDPAIRATDADAFRLFAEGIVVFGEQGIFDFTRSVGAALASIADSAMTVFGLNVSARFEERGLTELERARAFEASSEMLTNEVPRAINALLASHVEAAVRRSRASQSAGASTVRMAVGFLDLVRSTAMVQALEPDELASAIGRFEQVAIEIVGARGGRVVKTIGDEVMVVLPSATDACAAALDLRDSVAADRELPAIRGGIAIGDLVRGYGDYYGPQVNVAARIVRLADPGRVVVTAEVAREAGSADGLHFEQSGLVQLRGFEEPVPLFGLEHA